MLLRATLLIFFEFAPQSGRTQQVLQVLLTAAAVQSVALIKLAPPPPLLGRAPRRNAQIGYSTSDPTKFFLRSHRGATVFARIVGSHMAQPAKLLFKK